MVSRDHVSSFRKRQEENMATADQLEQAIRDVDAHHARVIEELKNRLSARIDSLEAQIAQLSARLQNLERKR